MSVELDRLVIPLFPPRPAHVSPFKDFCPQGIIVRYGENGERQLLQPDIGSLPPRPLVPLTTQPLRDPALVDGPDGPGRVPKKNGITVAKDGMGILPADDCWLIGVEDGNWVEPEGTSVSSYDLSASPFERLCMAAWNFHLSRRSALFDKRARSLHDIMRGALGLPQQGERGRSRRQKHWAAETPVEERLPEDETCAFLTDPVTSVRGLLAMARGELGCNLESAIRLAEITAAFLAFIVHYNVLPDIPQVKTAAALAASAPSKLRQADELERALSDGHSWNRAGWTLWGGLCAGRERGSGQHSSARSSSEKSGTGAEDDGNEWKVDSVVNKRQEQQSRLKVERLLAPARMEGITLLHYIPFACRKVVQFLPPLPCQEGRPTFQSTLPRLVTVPAPRRPDENWRAMSSLDADRDPEETTQVEKKGAAVQDPPELIIWVDAEVVQDYIGVGLRGRWAELKGPGFTWWIFEDNDFALPSFWQSSAVSSP